MIGNLIKFIRLVGYVEFLKKIANGLLNSLDRMNCLITE